MGLSEVDNNTNKCIDISENGCMTHLNKINNLPLRDRYEQKYRNQEKDALFHKISDLIREEEKGTPVCHSQKNRRFLKRKDRPYTSLSNKNRISQNISSCGKYQVVLDLTPKN